ncbi:MAG: Butyrate kinase 2 [Firmicutes bacterium]|nr:Butyrate kinase 2 [candidate division NPL-UPA2 bacterium]
MRGFKVLVINPGSTSTKVACYLGATVEAEESLSHSAQVLTEYAEILDQFTLRLDAVMSFVENYEVAAGLDAVVGRGGLLRPTQGGTYAVNEAMVADLRLGLQGQHASNLGGLLAKAIAEPLGLPAFIVDPVAVDEFEPVARLSGHPLLERRSLSHALSMKAVARRAASELDIPYAASRFIVAHLGGGISVGPMVGGRIIDVNNANEMGPFSPERTGGLPAGDLTALCFSGKYSAKEVKRQLHGQGGMVAYLGTSDAREAYRRADAGDARAELVMQAMAYQIAKEIGAMATVLQGRVDAVVLTGGLAHSDRMCNTVAGYVGFIAPMMVYRGEDEMLALAEGACRVLAGEEKLSEY